MNERAGSAWRQINLVGLNRRSVVACGVGAGHRLDEFIAGLLGNVRFNSHREKASDARCSIRTSTARIRDSTKSAIFAWAKPPRSGLVQRKVEGRAAFGASL